MVNGTASADTTDRRRRTRATGAHASVLGAVNRNPLGDLHTLQHLSARYARSVRTVFEPLLRQEVRAWAEPLVVQRFADYHAERPDKLTAWVPMAMTPGGGQALLVIDGRFALQILDLFFGGTGAAPHDVPHEFSPAAEALIARLAAMLAAPLAAAWEPVARLGFAPGRVELSPTLISDLDADDAMVVTRFGIAPAGGKPTHIDIVYPVAALKPFTLALTGKVHAREAVPDAGWRQDLTRAAMTVSFPVRSVLAEPMVALSVLMNLKPGDVIPISIGPEVPVMVGGDRLGTGTVGTSNGRAAVRLTSLTRFPEDHQ